MDVAEYRLKKAESSGPLPAEWGIEDHLVAMATRIGRLKVLGVELFTAAIRAYSVLWPDEPAPKSPEHLAQMLMDSETRLCQWRESAARAGADEALMVVLSWYEGLDLDLFQSFRSNGKYVTDPDWVEKRKKLAYSFVQYAKVHEFVEGPSFLDVDPEDEEEEDEEDAEEGVKEGAEEDQSDKEAEDAGTSKAAEVVPPPSTDVPSTSAFAPTTAAEVAAHELSKAFPPED